MDVDLLPPCAPHAAVVDSRPVRRTPRATSKPSSRSAATAPRPDAAAIGAAFLAGDPVCLEYSPELQLRVLHADADQLLEPVLDLGCGKHAALVRFLRERGKEAFGIDRVAPRRRFVVRADWLDWPLEPARWGTVLSHQGLSTHFLHQHLRPDGRPERHARRYMDVLRALKPGGSFRYAPGLPFFEELLPRDEYDVERFPVAELAGGAVDAALKVAFGTSVLFACRVTTRGAGGP